MRSATTPGAGSKLPYETGASAGAGSGTNSVSAIRLRNASGCARTKPASARTISGTSVPRRVRRPSEYQPRGKLHLPRLVGLSVGADQPSEIRRSGADRGVAAEQWMVQRIQGVGA